MSHSLPTKCVQRPNFCVVIVLARKENYLRNVMVSLFPGFVGRRAKGKKINVKGRILSSSEGMRGGFKSEYKQRARRRWGWVIYVIPLLSQSTSERIPAQNFY